MKKTTTGNQFNKHFMLVTHSHNIKGCTCIYFFPVFSKLVNLAKYVSYARKSLIQSATEMWKFWKSVEVGKNIM